MFEVERFASQLAIRGDKLGQHVARSAVFDMETVPDVALVGAYQVRPWQKMKLIRCTRRAVFDVVVDVRRSSLALGRWWR